MQTRGKSRSFALALLVGVTAIGSLATAANGAAAADAAASMPFVARLQMGEYDRSCTGVLVHPALVLTAAACFANTDGPAKTGAPALPTTVTIGAGTDGTQSQVTGIVVHPERDLALARLSTPNTSVTPVAIGAAAPTAGEVLTLAGFGRTATEWVPDKLKLADFAIQSVGSASLEVAPNDSATVGVCKGDAGGPALRRTGDAFELVGLHHDSNQAGCFGEKPGTPQATETRLDDMLSWVTDNVPNFSTGAETGDQRLAWQSTVDTVHGGLSSVGGVCCSLTGPELVATSKVPVGAHSGTRALMYSGLDKSSTKSFAYTKAYSPRHLKLRSTSVLSYWIFPQGTATNDLVSGSNSTCVAVDVIFTDGKSLRDSGATDQHGNRAHPAYQCGNLAKDKWNEVVVPIGTIAAGKQIDTITIGYDQPARTGGYRGYLDDIKISDVVPFPQFATGLAKGDPALTWTNTVSTGAQAGNLTNVTGVCCSLKGPELIGTSKAPDGAHGGSEAVLYSGKDNNATKSYAYTKGFQLNNVIVTPTTSLTYLVYPQSTATSALVSGNNSSCVAIDLILTDLVDGKQSSLRNSDVTDQHGNRAHPAHQCGKLTMDKWNEIVVPLGAIANGKQITQVDFAYDQAANTGGYRGFLDDIRIDS